MASVISKRLKNLDDDDDMEDFLSSILNDSGKKDKAKATSTLQKADYKQNDNSKPNSSKNNNHPDDDDDEFEGIFDSPPKSAMKELSQMSVSSGDQKAQLTGRPPTRSGSRSDALPKTPTVKEKEVVEDMDDIFSSMGLGSPKKQEAKNVSTAQGQGPAKGRSLVGGGGIGSASSRRTLESLLSLDDLEDAPKVGARKESRDDFSFGGYTPSSAGNVKSPANKRLVRFKSNDKSLDDDDKEDEANLLSTAPASLTSGLKNNEPDWLSDLGLGGPPPKVKDAERPRSVGSAAKGDPIGDLPDDPPKNGIGNGTSRKKSTDNSFKTVVRDSLKRQNVVNVLKLDVRKDDDDDDDDDDGGGDNDAPRRRDPMKHPSSASVAADKSAFSLDFLKDLDGDDDDGAPRKRDDVGLARGTKGKNVFRSKADALKSSTQVDQSELEQLMNRIKLLEADKEFLLEKIERMKEQREEEKKLIEDAFSKRVQLAEETFEKCQERLRQENEILSQDVLEKVRILEKEKSEMFGAHLRRMKELEGEKKEEVEQLRNDYRASIESMRQEHEASLQRILKTKNQELDVVISSRDHVRKLETALTHLEVNTADLDDLRSRVRSKADEAELDQQLALKLKESSLKAMQEKMSDREKEMEDEKGRLLDLISKLEKQLANQNAQIEQEKWQLKQEEVRLKNERSHLEKERTEFLESSQRERLDLEKMKSKLQAEQAKSTSELRGERARLVEERAEFEVELKLKGEEQERIASSKYKTEIEVNSMKKALTVKMEGLERRSREVGEAEAKLSEQRRALEEKRSGIEREKKALDRMAQQMNQSSKELVEKFEELEEEKERYKRLIMDAQSRDKEVSHKLEAFQKLTSTLRSRDDPLVEDQIPVRDDSNFRRVTNNAMNSHQHFDALTLFTPEERRSHENLMGGTGDPTCSHDVSPPFERFHPKLGGGPDSMNLSDKNHKEWRTSFLKDMNYLQKEKYFVHAVRNMSRIFS